MPCAACQGKSQGFQRVNDSPTRPVKPVSSNPTRYVVDVALLRLSSYAARHGAAFAQPVKAFAQLLKTRAAFAQ